MPIPWKYRIVFIIVLLLWLTAALVKFICDMDYMNYVISLTLILTLIFLMKYAYDTSLIAKEVWYPVANYVITNAEQDRFDISFDIKSHYKLALKCWCRLNASVYGKPVKMTGFYGTEHPINLQPLGKVHAHFRIQDILNHTKYNVEDMIERFTDEDAKKQLYMDVEFWYETMDGELKNTNPKQPHYFNFRKTKLVLDV